MSKEARDWAYSQSLKAPAKPVLVALAEHGAECWPSVTRLAEMTGYCVRTVRNALADLEEMKLISVFRQVGRTTRFRLEIGQKLSTTPAPDAPLHEMHPGTTCRTPRHEVQDTPAPDAGDPGTTCTRTVKNRKGTGREPKKGAVELPEWVPRQTWADFVEHRRKAKTPMTDIAQQRALKKLAVMRAEGQDIEAVIEQSIINGWKGLFPVKEARGPGSRGDRFSNSVAALQSLFGDEHGQDNVSAGLGLPVGGLFEGDHEGAGGGVLGSARRSAG